MSPREANVSSRRQVLRRYPAGLLLLASALLSSLLPSALRLPLSGPSASAELAPVPGKSDQSGDLAELGQSETAGLGAGAGGGGGGGGGGAREELDELGGNGGGTGTNPQGKRCVGKPRRQAEDLLSPPCVAYFEGDNGGATSRGVTADEVRIVHIHSPLCTLEAPYEVDYRDDKPNDGFSYIAAYQNYFTERYQMYGRTAHFYTVGYPCEGSTMTPAEGRAQAQRIYDDYRPFAVVLDRYGIDPWSVPPLLEELASRGVITLSVMHRPVAQRLAPHLMSYLPDYEDRAEIEAAAVCRKLVGRVAAYSGDPRDHSTTRKFGLVYEPEGLREGAGNPSIFDRDLFTAALERRCGLKGLPEATGGDADQRAIALNELRSAGVTTVLSYSEKTDWSVAADVIKWYPEWYLGTTPANAERARLQTPTVWANAFGLTYERRLGPKWEQDWYIAFRQTCETRCTTNNAMAPMYEDFLLLFTGIQSAGPRLTPANVDRGLHAIKPQPSPDPYTPAAYFSPGNYTFVKDAMFVWWDPQGRPPGVNSAGCYRLVEHGKRYRAEDWPDTDDGIKGRNEPNQPCQGLAQ